MLHAEGVRVDFVGEVGGVLGLDELGEVAYVPVVQLDHLVGPAQQALSVGLRVAVQENVVAALRVHVVRVVEVGVDAYLLLPAVAAQRPDPVELCGRPRAFVVLGVSDFVQLALLAADHVLERVHGGQVELVVVGPAVALDAVLHHALLGVGVRRGDGQLVLVDPLVKECLAGLSDDEIVLVGGQFHALGVGARVQVPLEGLPEVRVEEHEHLGQLAEAIEDELRRILRDVEDPVERLQRHVGDVHVHAAVLGDDGLAHEVGLGLRVDRDLVVLDGPVEALVELLADVVLDVAVVDFPHLEARLLGAPPQVLDAHRVADARPLQPSVPEEPDDFRQRAPGRRTQVGRGHFDLLLHDLAQIVAAEQQVLGHEGLRVDELAVPALLNSLLQLVANLLIKRQHHHIPLRAGRLLQLFQRVLGQVSENLVGKHVLEDLPDLPGKIARVDCEEPVLVNSKAVHAALVGEQPYELELPFVNDDVRGEDNPELVRVLALGLTHLQFEGLAAGRQVVRAFEYLVELLEQAAEELSLGDGGHEEGLEAWRLDHVLLVVGADVWLVCLGDGRAEFEVEEGEVLRPRVLAAAINIRTGVDPAQPGEVLRQEDVFLDQHAPVLMQHPETYQVPFYYLDLIFIFLLGFKNLLNPLNSLINLLSSHFRNNFVEILLPNKVDSVIASLCIVFDVFQASLHIATLICLLACVNPYLLRDIEVRILNLAILQRIDWFLCTGSV